MKKILLLITSLLFCIEAYSQSLSFDQIIHLRNRKDLDSFMVSKSFVVTKYSSTQGKEIDFYVINEGTVKEEKVNVSKYGTSYSTFDSTYVAALTKEIQRKYSTVAKYDEGDYKFYQFGDTHLLIIVTIEKRAGHSSSIGISWK